MNDIELKKIDKALLMMTKRDATSGGADDRRWAVILAGGDGTRLRSLTRAIAGDDRPKQFCPIVKGATLLQQTRERAALSILPARTMFVVTEHHKVFYQPLLTDVACERIVSQPVNQGTAPAILYSLLRLAAVNPDASVVFFPSDHYFSDDARFMAHVEMAFEAVGARPDLIVLLGITPTGPEVEYGWIEPASRILLKTPDALSRVRRFWEKPSRAHARMLFSRECLWNSFVMVGRVQEFLHVVRRTLPELYMAFERIRPTFGTTLEQRAVRALYREIPSGNFSHEVLAAAPDDLAVLPVREVEWNDLGEPARVLSTLAAMGAQVEWLSQAV